MKEQGEKTLLILAPSVRTSEKRKGGGKREGKEQYVKEET